LEFLQQNKIQYEYILASRLFIENLTFKL